MNKNENNLPSIEIEPNSPATASVIWLHGLGADGNDFVPIVPELKLPKTLPVRFIFPHAPVMPVTLNNNYEMRAWFDITALTLNAQIDYQGITKSIQALQALIATEVARGILTQRIILAGFSQGAVIALLTGISYPQPLAGVMALSGYLPSVAQEIVATVSAANKSIPIFMAHGTEDPIVPYEFGKATYAMLNQVGFHVSWHSYPMSHSVCDQEIEALSQWIQEVLR